ncbi:MAG: outer membrane protein assembly factor, partial [Muribaculaceae bacterium]|nr:outer membrane protein assembly factor [Muribaculaceae bacterium]
NSEGDLGFGVGLGFQHRNLGRGSELLSAKFRTSYESLSGNFEGLVNKRYSEYAGEVGLTFPQFKAPFLSRSFKQRILASSELALSFNYQERPEYTRIIWGLGWKYKWQQQRWGYTRRHTYDLVDINYVRLPRSTIDFINQIAPTNPLLRYSYEDHFIMRMGYTFQTTNKRVPSAGSGTGSFQPVVTNLRTSVETAGNLLYGISKLVKQRKHDDVYKILGIQYAQYVKGEVDYTFTRNFTPRSSLAMHGGFGIAVPYGNSSMVPFEKRFYGGGANGVRGWGVRTLGPGAYDARNSVTDFINQCGDISLDLSLEYRHKIFWVIEGAVFADAGNIWTIRDYENQPGGVFKFNTFYKQIAAAYGAGIRLDFTYFLLRLDLGLKAVNPAQNQEHWPIIHPKWSRDATFHFSVGYPF